MSGIGSSLGSAAGGAIGTALLPGIGTALGSSIGGMIGGQIAKGGGSSGGSGTPGAAAAGMGIATGLLQEFKANKLKNKAESAFPSFTDPSQAGYLAELDQKRRSMETGAAFQSGMDAIDATNAGTNDAIVKSTSGDVGSTIQSLLQSQRGANASKNQVLAQGQQQQMGYDTLYGNLLNQISARKLQLQMQRSQQAMAEWSKMKQGANQNMMAGLAGAAPMVQGAVTPDRGASAEIARGANLTQDQNSFEPIDSAENTLPGVVV